MWEEYRNENDQTITVVVDPSLHLDELDVKLAQCFVVDLVFDAFGLLLLAHLDLHVLR